MLIPVMMKIVILHLLLLLLATSLPLAYSFLFAFTLFPYLLTMATIVMRPVWCWCICWVVFLDTVQMLKYATSLTSNRGLLVILHTLQSKSTCSTTLFRLRVSR